MKIYNGHRLKEYIDTALQTREDWSIFLKDMRLETGLIVSREIVMRWATDREPRLTAFYGLCAVTGIKPEDFIKEV